MQAAVPLPWQEVAAAAPYLSSRLAVVPFVKWAGGKGQLLGQLAPFFPPAASYRRYFEPFLGGGAVFFHLQPRQAVLSDLNDELMNAYSVIRDRLEPLITALREHRDDDAYYYALREVHPSRLDDVERASRFIFLNKRCYNGLYRVNRKGFFNVPKGKYRTPPRIFDEGNLRRVSTLLANARLNAAPYDRALEEAQAGDFVYLDPPYQPLSSTSYFTAYTKDSFTLADQRHLAEVLRELDARGVRFILNNHDTDELRALYTGFRIEVALASRMINSRADRRGEVRELIVTNCPAG